MRVPDQSIQVLAMLLEHPGEVVTRNELLQRLWPNGTIVEFDQNINAAVKRLRQALEDSAEAPRYIETLPRLGYRFIATIALAPAEPPVSDICDFDAGDQPGEVVSHYRIVEKIGAGGMGVVYAAVDTRLGRSVALKFLPEEFAEDKAALERFRREGRAASALSHPNICTLYDIGKVGARPFLAMELLEGQTLLSLIAAGPLAVDMIVELGLQIADALEAAHGKGVIHRDIKPSNIFVTARGFAKIMDFGLAKLAPARASSLATYADTEYQATLVRSPIGTVAYMSPEQARGEVLDARSDLFSFGVVLYEMATGIKPFQGDTTAVLFDAILNKTPVPPLELRPDLFADLAAIICKALEKHPEMRFQTAGELAAGLRRVKRNISLTPAKLESAVRNVPWINIRGLAGAPSKWVIVTTALVLMMGGAYFAGRQHKIASDHAVSENPIRFTSLPGVETMPAFSPDGRQIAYVHSDRDPLAFNALGKQVAQANIYIKLIGAGTELRVTDHAGADYHPAWSPDAQFLAYYRDAAGDSGYYTVSAFGGMERRISDERTHSSGIAWFPSGQHLVVSQVSEGSHSAPLLDVAVDTGKRRQLTSPPAGTLGDGWPAISPDGKTLAFTRIKDSGAFDLCFMPVSPAGAVRCRQVDASMPAGLAWTAKGDALISSSIMNMAPRLWRYDVARGTVSILSSGEEVAEYPAVSRQGVLAYVISSRRVSIWQLDLASSGHSTGEKKRIAYSSTIESDPAFSPDARKIAFVSVRSGSPEIWVTNIDTHASTQLTRFGALSTGSPSWSPDGMRITFDAALPATGSQIYVIAADGGAPRQITSGPGENAVPSWSADGKYVYYASNRSGEFQIWKSHAETGETASNPASRITRRGGFRAIESIDGRYLYFAKGRGKPGLWRLDLLGSPEDEKPVLESLQQWGWWAVSGESIHFFELPDDVNPQPRLKALNVRTGGMTELVQMAFPVLTATPALAAARDGHHLAYTQVDSMEGDIVLRRNQP